MKVFLDTNVIIDVLAAREPFFRDSQRVVDYCERHSESGFLSSLTFCTAAYVLRKSVGKDMLPDKLKTLRKIFDILPVTKGSVDWAIDSQMPDFEDAMQYECASAAKMDVIVTRDKSGFLGAEIPVLSPTEFVTKYV